MRTKSKYGQGKNPNSHIKGLFQKGHEYIKGGEKGWFKKGSKTRLGKKHREETKIKTAKEVGSYRI